MSTTTGPLLFDAGYTDLVSVLPPDAKLSSKSDIPLDQRGKAPGKFDGNRGDWAGYNWREFVPKRAHVELWEQAGANIGLHARRFPGVDIDCLDPEMAVRIESIAYRVLGPAPLRWGRIPKRLLVYGTNTPFTRMRLWLKPPAWKEGDARHLIEVLGDGQQYVVAGRHPAGFDYKWDRALHNYDILDDLRVINPELVDKFFDEVRDELDLAGWTCEREGKGRLSAEGGMVQESLLAPSFEACEAAVKALPNRSVDFPSRDSMNEVGYAIKAAVGEAGLPLFVEWALRWEDGANDPDYVEEQWQRFVPPFRVGWEWLVGKARELGGYSDAADDFEAIEAPTPSAGGFDALEAPPDGPPAPPPSPDKIAAEKEGPPPPKYTDRACARAIVNRFGGNLRFCEPLGGWMTLREGRWIPDETRAIEHFAGREMAKQANDAWNDAALGRKAEAVAGKLSSASAQGAALTLARSDRRVAIESWRFDADPWALNTPAGIVDLRTGIMGPLDPKGYHTKSTLVAPQEGRPVRWLTFLAEALGDDEELIRYMQKKAGYWLTGMTVEQELTFAWGPGGNGKGVFANTIANIMGDYAMRTPPATFAATRNEAHPEQMARLRGARLVLTTEVQEGQAWDEAKVKMATGGDSITARHMNQGSFDYKPQFKLLFLGNHKPRIRNLDDAMKRRIHLVPMTVKPRVVNIHLEEDLHPEAGMILQWMIEGCRLWQEEGLRMPKAVREATLEYFTDEDIVGRFLEDTCTREAGAFETTHDLYEAWTGWAREQGEFPQTATWLARRLTGRPGIEKRRMNLWGFTGVKLKVRPGEFEAVPGAKMPGKT